MYFLTVHMDMDSNIDIFRFFERQVLKISTYLCLIRFTLSILPWFALDLFIYLELSPKSTSN